MTTVSNINVLKLLIRSLTSLRLDDQRGDVPSALNVVKASGEGGWGCERGAALPLFVWEGE